MVIDIVTKEDLEQLRRQLLRDIQELITPQGSKMPRPWLKNSEVRKLLNISSNTIQSLRISGKLKSSKIGGIHYYRYEDIQKLLNSDAA